MDRMIKATREQNKWLEDYEYETGFGANEEASAFDKDSQRVYAEPISSMAEADAKLDEQLSIEQ